MVGEMCGGGRDSPVGLWVGRYSMGCNGDNMRLLMEAQDRVMESIFDSA